MQQNIQLNDVLRKTSSSRSIVSPSASSPNLSLVSSPSSTSRQSTPPDPPATLAVPGPATPHR